MPIVEKRDLIIKMTIVMVKHAQAYSSRYNHSGVVPKNLFESEKYRMHRGNFFSTAFCYIIVMSGNIQLRVHNDWS